MKVMFGAALAAAAVFAAAPASAQSVRTGAEGTYGRVTLNAGFTPDPYSVTVMAGGPVDASRLGDTCVGQLPERPSFTLNYRAGETWPLYISATSEGDAVIAVRAPNGQWSCNDDTDGLNPAVHFAEPRSGRYQIFVGVYGGDAGPATLHISEVGTGGGAAGGAPDWTLDPAYGEVSLTAGFEPDPHLVQIMAGGELDAGGIGAPGCVGYIARAPDFRLHWTAGGELPLIISAASTADTTLVVNDPGDNWVCDDDGGEQGLNPAVTFSSPQSGQYDIWIGTYSPGPLQPAVLSISEVESQ